MYEAVSVEIDRTTDVLSVFCVAFLHVEDPSVPPQACHEDSKSRIKECFPNSKTTMLWAKTDFRYRLYLFWDEPTLLRQEVYFIAANPGCSPGRGFDSVL